ncbi:MAG: AAA family ATPase [Chitinivibrionales bacterium]|nr:AAA family ATPase [Chitinivibrionales bacterium]
MLLTRFIEAFRKAIRLEMDAMRERLGPFEAPLAGGQLVRADDAAPAYTYRFTVLEPNEKLIAGTECTLRYGAAEMLVTVDRVDGALVQLRADSRIALDSDSIVLVIYPWFLYEKLISSLERLENEPDEYCIQSALRTFGKAPVHQVFCSRPCDDPDLNESQRRAVALCAESDLAFVWGPPGTGKTTTLARIVATLADTGRRILVTSTTNAAVDQALAKLHDDPRGKGLFESDRVVRMGSTDAPTFGAGLHEVLQRRHDEYGGRLQRLHASVVPRNRQTEQCAHALAQLGQSAEPQQIDLFGDRPTRALDHRALSGVFPQHRLAALLARPSDRLQHTIARRHDRLERAQTLTKEAIEELERALRGKEHAVVRQARVVLATMSMVNIHTLLADQRYDVVIAEEAGMAILPLLFYCAALATRGTVLVGDPRQLPPIVQSRDEYVRQAMGRSIFEVTVPSYTEQHLVMLDTQYRMHPSIGDLVSTLFYDGRLRNHASTAARSAIVDGEPFAGSSLVLCDTQGTGECSTAESSYSRRNELSARHAAGLAQAAVSDGARTVAVITPYVAQSRRIRDELRRLHIGTDLVRVHTVHRFQGNECDVVILDTVDCAPLPPGILLTGAPGRSASENLINVSISRARGKLIVLADVAYFRRHVPGSTLCRLFDAMMRQGTVVAVV